MGEASVEIPKAIAEPAVKATALSAKVAVPLLSSVEGVSGFLEDLSSIDVKAVFVKVQPLRHEGTKFIYNKYLLFVSWCLGGYSFRFIWVGSLKSIDKYFS
jgi:hypothetical protein